MVRTASESGDRENGELTIRELTPDHLDDFLDFFDNAAFADNPAWFGCYCMYYHFMGTDQEFQRCSASENREAISTLIRGEKLTVYLPMLTEGLWAGVMLRRVQPYHGSNSFINSGWKTLNRSARSSASS